MTSSSTLRFQSCSRRNWVRTLIDLVYSQKERLKRSFTRTWFRAVSFLWAFFFLLFLFVLQGSESKCNGHSIDVSLKWSKWVKYPFLFRLEMPCPFGYRVRIVTKNGGDLTRAAWNPRKWITFCPFWYTIGRTAETTLKKTTPKSRPRGIYQKNASIFLYILSTPSAVQLR